jgi:hypothetical protein
MRRLLAVLFFLALASVAQAQPASQPCYYDPVSKNCTGVALLTPLPVLPTGAGSVIGITPTDRTITSATGSSQTVMAANASRHSLTVVNTGNANCGINPTGGTAVIGGAGTLTLVPFGSYTPRIPTLSAVTAICTSGQPLYANES